MSNTTGPKTRDGLTSPSLKRMQRLPAERLRVKREALKAQRDRLLTRLVNLERSGQAPSLKTRRIDRELCHLNVLIEHANELVERKQAGLSARS